MRIRKGIEIWLAHGAKIPQWVRNQDKNITVQTQFPNGNRTRKLRIRNGEGCFVPGGAFGLKMPGSSNFPAAFPPLMVLLFVNLATKEEIRNHYYCEKCVANTGEIIARSDGTIAGMINSTFACTGCGHTWHFENI